MLAGQQIRFYIHLSSEDYLLHYQGIATGVVVRALDGRRVQIPAHHFRRFVTHEGVHGQFELTLDENHRLLGLRKIA